MTPAHSPTRRGREGGGRGKKKGCWACSQRLGVFPADGPQDRRRGETVPKDKVFGYGTGPLLGVATTRTTGSRRTHTDGESNYLKSWTCQVVVCRQCKIQGRAELGRGPRLLL